MNLAVVRDDHSESKDLLLLEIFGFENKKENFLKKRDKIPFCIVFFK